MHLSSRTPSAGFLEAQKSCGLLKQMRAWERKVTRVKDALKAKSPQNSLRIREMGARRMSWRGGEVRENPIPRMARM